MGLPSGLGNSAAPHTLKYDGRTYEARIIDSDRKVKFAKELFRRKREAAREGADGDRVYLKERLAVLEDEYAIGKFAFLSLEGVKFQQTEAGALYLVSLIFDLSEEEAINLSTAVPVEDEVVALVRVILKESFPNVNFNGAVVPESTGSDPDPNVPAPSLVSTTV